MRDLLHLGANDVARCGPGPREAAEAVRAA
jgi:hypothetical protein